MQVACVFCGRVTGEGPAIGKGRITRGKCMTCEERWKRAIEESCRRAPIIIHLDDQETKR